MAGIAASCFGLLCSAVYLASRVVIGVPFWAAAYRSYWVLVGTTVLGLICIWGLDRINQSLEDGKVRS